MKGQLLNLNYTGRTPHSLYHPSQTPCGVCLFSLPVSPRACPVLCNEYLKHTFRHVYTACNSAACVILQHTLRRVSKCRLLHVCVRASLVRRISACMRGFFLLFQFPLSSFLISDVCCPKGKNTCQFFSPLQSQIRQKKK